MNQLPLERRVAVVAALCEGNSIRSTVRLTGVAKNTITKRDKLATSMMPSGLNQALSQEDLVNLVEYLSTLKKK